ncbi:kinase-like domain-containing protein [Rhizophagus irregularis DAOM 181602=DAOM 197198]|nr:kinase-like domain-containing protein [Rhizophagus irregularis DAOM 181602=DAOM 197198]
MEAIDPRRIVEWIPYDNLQSIKYLTKGGFSEIYTAFWINGAYYEWDTMKHQLTRFGNQGVILKRLESVGSADQSWFEEAKSHFTISNKSPDIVQCHGLTQDPSDGNYMLKKIKETYQKYLNMPNELEENNNLERNKTNSLKEVKETSSILFTSSKIYNFESFPEPRNATEGEQEAFHSKSYDNFYIPDSVDDFGKSNDQENYSTSNKISIFKVNNADIKNDYNSNKEIMKHHSYIDDEVYNNPNLHSEEQDEFEIPDDI